MCRIAGIAGSTQDVSNLSLKVKAMCNAMEHGGPDSQGTWVAEDGRLALGHRRLSFLDLSPLGHQPMLDTNSRCRISFNGEIYNFLELKSELLAKGYTFKSHSDTEVILSAYLEWGTAAFGRFNGMFAFALHDIAKNELFLVRDAAGIKPLYYFLDSQKQLVFASEVRSFRKLNARWPENPDWKLLLLTFGHIPEPHTTLQGVKALEKGYYIRYDLENRLFLEKKAYRKLEYSRPQLLKKEEAMAAVREQLKAAVERHLISDAPVGLFLSGGIDSSLLTLLAADTLKDQLHTLSVTFSEEDFSEKEYQQAIIDQVHCKHQNYTLGKEDLINNLDRIRQAYDQPSNDGINSWFISRAAHENGLKAVLSGLGSDELFGGYPSFSRINNLFRLKGLPSGSYQVARLLPSAPLRRIGWMQIKQPVGLYLTLRGLCTPEEAAVLSGISRSEVIRRISALEFSPEITAALTAQETAGWLEFNYYMQNQLLKDADYMSMQHSLELRVPFLDQDLIDTVYRIDRDLLYAHGGLPKQLLIDSFKDILPEKIWNRKKMGFSFPFQKWFAGIEPIRTAVTSTTPGRALWQRYEQGQVHWSKIWAYYLTLTFYIS